MDAQLKKRIEKYKLFIRERYFSPDPTRKSLKEGALPHLNIPRKSVLSSSSKTKICSTTAIQKPKESVIFQDISPLPSPSIFFFLTVPSLM